MIEDERNVHSMEPASVGLTTVGEDGEITESRGVRIPLRDEFPVEEVTLAGMEQ